MRLKNAGGAAALLLAACLSGCSGGYVAVAPTPPDNFARLGRAEGTGCGTLFVISTAYNIFPILLNERVERAYAAALESVPGATALIDVTLSENWYWWVLGTTRCVTITGEAVK